MRQFHVLIALIVFCAPMQAGEKVPSRKLAIQALLDFHRSLEEKDFKKALTYLKLPKEATGMEDKVIEGLQKIAGSSELSKKGIEILGMKGEWNLLTKIQSEDEAKRMSRGSPLDKCFGLFAEPRRGAAFYWDGTRLLITHFNNIGRLDD